MQFYTGAEAVPINIKPANDAHAVYANSQKKHSEFVMGCVKFEEGCKCSVILFTSKEQQASPL
jgi:hypothetical protein